MTNKALSRVLKICAKELARLDADWAIGGALAMSTHGYSRSTDDIDLFIGDDVRVELLEHLKKKGIAVDEVIEDIHYAVIPDRSAPESRIDLRFPSSEPDVSAIMRPAYAKIEGQRMPVWPLDLIVANKLLSDRPKDAFDLTELRSRGLIDADAVVRFLQSIREREAIERLRQLMTPRRRT